MKGYALRGIFGGFFAGFFLAVTLWFYGAIPFASSLMWVLPILGVAIGLTLAIWAPLGGSSRKTTASTERSSYQVDGGSERSEPSSKTLEQDVVDIELQSIDEPVEPSDE